MKGLRVIVDAILSCPTCQASPNLATFNERRRAGVGQFTCAGCGKVANVTDWLRLAGEVREPSWTPEW